MKKLTVLALVGLGIAIGLNASDIKRYIDMRRM